MMPDHTELTIADGYVEGPIDRPGHKHWAATVTSAPRDPLGCKRKWWRRAGWCRYHVPPKLKTGDIVEFRVADDVSTGDSLGHQERQFRYIGIVTAISETTIMLVEEMSLETAFESVEKKKTVPPDA